MKGRIYVIENLITTKKYVGQTMYSLENRIKGHQGASYKGKSRIATALRKYGVESFIYYTYGLYDIDDLCTMETKTIKKLNTLHPYGYNVKLVDGSNQKVFKSNRQKKLDVFDLSNEKDREYMIKPPIAGFSEIRIRDLYLFCDRQGLNYYKMLGVLAGHYKQYKGYKIKYYLG